MDIMRAKEILEILADGVNPMTGEVLPAIDSCNQVEVVRALHAVLKHINVEQEKQKRPQPENAGKPWTQEDEEILCRMFDTGCTRKEICNHFQRSQGAIAARLVKLGKIQEREEFRSRQVK